MDNLVQYTLYLHILVGGISLLSGAVAIFSAKGKKMHRLSGKVYFWAMTVVFMTGIIVASYRFNRFLFLIAFLSYYSVFSGVRFLKLKQLHRNQNPKWFDWMAGVVNGLANLAFVIYGIYLFLMDGLAGGTLLSLGFGIGGLMLTYTNLKPFVVHPHRANHWYTAHLGNMMGGYIATFTAFLSTLAFSVSIHEPLFSLCPTCTYWRADVGILDV